MSVGPRNITRSIARGVRMASTPAARASLSHVERTAKEPRENGLHRVLISQIDQVNDKIRLLRLTPVEKPHTITHLPGQWLDVYIPSLPKAGGFTITSPPSTLTVPKPYLELAIQRTPNPPATWLSEPTPTILNAELQVRVGGSFVFPPVNVGYEQGKIKRIVFIAGGVGVNPLMSMLSSIASLPQEQRNFGITLLYSTRVSKNPPFTAKSLDDILFLPRLMATFSLLGDQGSSLDSDGLKLFFTGVQGENGREGLLDEVRYETRRIEKEDVLQALGSEEEREQTVCYVCAGAKMTDEVVGWAKGAVSMSEERVLCEKWW